MKALETLKVSSVRSWASVHIFIHDFSRLTDFLRDYLGEMPEKLLDTCFFVRYWLGGPHLRIRTRDVTFLPMLEDAAQRYWKNNSFVSALERESFYLAYAEHLHTENEQYWHENGSVQLIAYEPEIARYGGPQGLPLCEDEFVSDSKLMLGMLKKESQSSLEKIMFGFSIVYAMVMAKHDLYSSYLRFCYGTDDRAQVRQLIQRRSKGKNAEIRDSLLAIFERIANENYFPEYLIPLQQRLDVLISNLALDHSRDTAAICASLLHMSFNRSGIAPAKESNVKLFATSILCEVY